MKVEEFGVQDCPGDAPPIRRVKKGGPDALPRETGRTLILRAPEGREWSAFCHH